jgi:two-component system cell cycle response regulator
VAVSVAHVLMIEDTAHNLELMTYLLEAAGHTVTAAATGATGIELAVTEPPDLILVDIQLPDASGYDVLTTLRATPQTRRLPILAVTANAMVGDRDAALSAGFDGYVAKPIEPRTFSRDVEGFLPARLRDADPGHT